MDSTSSSRPRRTLLLILGVLGAVVLTAGAVVFKPWLLFINTEVNEVLPQDKAATAPVSTTGSTADTGPVLVSKGEFVSHEHTTTGTASIYRLSNGRYQLALADLNTSNGPDVRVWFSAGPVVEGRDGWFTAGKYPHLDIAPIKGNRGNQVYDLPEDFDPAAWPTVDLWCEDFSVSFGAAALVSVA